MENEFGIKPKKSKKKLLIIIPIIIVILAVLAYFGYTKIYNSPKNVFNRSLDKAFTEVENFVDDITNIDKITNKDSIIVKENLGVNIDVDSSLLKDQNAKYLINELNKIKIETEVGYDAKNNKMALLLDSKYNNGSLLNVAAYMVDEKVYLELKNIYNKLIELPVENLEESVTGKSNINIDRDEIKYILDTFKETVGKNLDSKSFKTSKETIKIDGKDVKVEKITYSINEKNTQELTKVVVKSLSKNDKFIKNLADLMGTEKSVLKKQLELASDSLKEVDSSKLSKENIAFLSVYVTGFDKKNVGYGFEVPSAKTEISYYKKDGKREIDVKSYGETILSASIKKDSAVIKLSSGKDVISINVTKKVEGKTTTYNFNTNISGAIIEGSVSEKLVKEEKDSKETETVISLSATVAGMKVGTITLNGTSSVEYNKEVTIPSITNTIKAENMSEADLALIQNKIMQNPVLVQLVSTLSSQFGSVNTSGCSGTKCLVEY